jgi:hypothetical protein
MCYLHNCNLWHWKGKFSTISVVSRLRYSRNFTLSQHVSNCFVQHETGSGVFADFTPEFRWFQNV